MWLIVTWHFCGVICTQVSWLTDTCAVWHKTTVTWRSNEVLYRSLYVYMCDITRSTVLHLWSLCDTCGLSHTIYSTGLCSLRVLVYACVFLVCVCLCLCPCLTCSVACLFKFWKTEKYKKKFKRQTIFSVWVVWTLYFFLVCTNYFFEETDYF